MARNKKVNRKYYLNRKVKACCRLHTGKRVMYVDHAVWANIEGAGNMPAKERRQMVYMTELRDKYNYAIQLTL
jgi:hypothetical protein